MVRFAIALLAMFSLSLATAGVADLNPAAISYKLPDKIPWSAAVGAQSPRPSSEIRQRPAYTSCS
jgi:hypothetical protein